MRAQVFILITAVILTILLFVTKFYSSPNNELFLYEYNLKNELNYMFSHDAPPSNISKFLSIFKDYLNEHGYTINYACAVSSSLHNTGLNDCAGGNIQYFQDYSENSTDYIRSISNICTVVPSGKTIYIFPNFFCLCYNISSKNGKESIVGYYCSTSVI